MAIPGEERDIRGKPCKATNGAYGIPTAEQNGRMYELGQLAREHRKLFEPVMAFDSKHAKDDRGERYWGSKRHVIESALRLLEREIERVLHENFPATGKGRP